MEYQWAAFEERGAVKKQKNKNSTGEIKNKSHIPKHNEINKSQANS